MKLSQELLSRSNVMGITFGSRTLFWPREAYLKTFTFFDGVQIAYHDEGKGPSVILLHGCFVDVRGQFGEFNSECPGWYGVPFGQMKTVSINSWNRRVHLKSRGSTPGTAHEKLGIGGTLRPRGPFGTLHPYDLRVKEGSVKMHQTGRAF